MTNDSNGLYSKICKMCKKKFNTCFEDSEFHSLECRDAYKLSHPKEIVFQ